MAQGKILVASHDGVYVLKLEGDVRVTLCGAVDSFLETMFADPELSSIVVDLSDAEAIDSTTLGLLARLSIESKERLGAPPTLISTRKDITRVLVTMGLDDVFNILEEPLSAPEQLGELECVEIGEDAMRRKVIDAHRALMDLNGRNQATFQDLVDALEAGA